MKASKTKVHAPAGELLHCDSLLDEVLSLRVNERQDWILDAPLNSRLLRGGFENKAHYINSAVLKCLRVRFVY